MTLDFDPNRRFRLNFRPRAYWKPLELIEPDRDADWDDATSIVIARLEWWGVLASECALLAAPDGDRIRYRVRDENAGRFDAGTGEGPLSLGEVLEMFQLQEDTDPFAILRYVREAEEMFDTDDETIRYLSAIVSGSSPFYRQFAEYVEWEVIDYLRT
jgi:hypothetical protein